MGIVVFILAFFVVAIALASMAFVLKIASLIWPFLLLLFVLIVLIRRRQNRIAEKEKQIAAEEKEKNEIKEIEARNKLRDEKRQSVLGRLKNLDYDKYDKNEVVQEVLKKFSPTNKYKKHGFYGGIGIKNEKIVYFNKNESSDYPVELSYKGYRNLQDIEVLELITYFGGKIKEKYNDKYDVIVMPGSFIDDNSSVFEYSTFAFGYSKYQIILTEKNSNGILPTEILDW